MSEKIPEGPGTLWLAAPKFHYWLVPGHAIGDAQNGLWLLADCLGGEHDGSAIPLLLEREHAAVMWPKLKQYAEEGKLP